MNWRGGAVGMVVLVAGCTAAPEPLFVWERQAGGVWCYRTVAEPDCHPAPVAGEQDRLIASGPEAYFSWHPNPALDPSPARPDHRPSR